MVMEVSAPATGHLASRTAVPVFGPVEPFPGMVGPGTMKAKFLTECASLV